MDYAEYLPHIDVNDGKARVMNNLTLYKTLLKKFNSHEIADNLLDAMNKDDAHKVAQLSHALRGTAANLSFPALQVVASDIEKLAKSGKDSSHMAEALMDAVDNLKESIGRLTAS